jgi:hypothetical protein
MVTRKFHQADLGAESVVMAVMTASKVWVQLAQRLHVRGRPRGEL